MKKKPIIIIVIIVAGSGILFMLLTGFNNETSLSHIQVNGTVTTNSTTIPRFVYFNAWGTTSVKVESGFYSTTLPNDLSYGVVVDYAYKIPLPPPKFTGNGGAPSWSADGLCQAGKFDLHAKSNHVEYNISCPKM